MAEQIKDGGGGGFLAIVSSEGKLKTLATTVEQRLHATVEEEYWETTTGVITLSDASETPMIYIKNTDNTRVIVIDRVFFDSFESTGGSGSGKIRYYVNPTISGGSDADVTNTNYGSSITPTATLTKSPASMSGTVWWVGQLSTSTSIALEEGRIVIPPGFAHGISIEAPGSNTSYDISINVAFFQVKKEDID